MNSSEKIILLIGDSFGIKRVYQGDCYVSAEGAWPEQVKRQFPNHKIISDFRSYRRFVEIPQMITEKYPDCDLVIVHAGIVDCFPRPLSSDVTRSPKKIYSWLRRLVRKMRRFWINYIYNKAWSSAEDIENACNQYVELGKCRQIALITPVPMPLTEYINTPGVQESLIVYANRLRALSKEHQFDLIDIHKELIASDFSKYLYPHDMHLNQLGNDWLAQQAIDYLKAKLQSASSPNDQSQSKVATGFTLC